MRPKGRGGIGVSIDGEELKLRWMVLLDLLLWDIPGSFRE